MGKKHDDDGLQLVIDRSAFNAIWKLFVAGATCVLAALGVAFKEVAESPSHNDLELVRFGVEEIRRELNSIADDHNQCSYSSLQTKMELRVHKAGHNRAKASQ